MTGTPVTKDYFQKKDGWDMDTFRTFMQKGAFQNVYGPKWPPKEDIVQLAIDAGITQEEAKEWLSTKIPLERLRPQMSGTAGGNVGNVAGSSEDDEQMQTEEDHVMDQGNDFDATAANTQEAFDGQVQTETRAESGAWVSTGTDAPTTLQSFPRQRLWIPPNQQPTDNERAFKRWTTEERHDHTLGGLQNAFTYQATSVPVPANFSNTGLANNAQQQIPAPSTAHNAPNQFSTGPVDNSRYQTPAASGPAYTSQHQTPTVPSSAYTSQNRGPPVFSSSNVPNSFNSTAIANPQPQTPTVTPPNNPPNITSAAETQPSAPESDPFGYTYPDPSLPSQVNISRDPWFPFANREDAESSDSFRLDSFGALRRNDGGDGGNDGGEGM